jgi:hypothetical protein
VSFHVVKINTPDLFFVLLNSISPGLELSWPLSSSGLSEGSLLGSNTSLVLLEFSNEFLFSHNIINSSGSPFFYDFFWMFNLEFDLAIGVGVSEFHVVHFKVPSFFHLLLDFLVFSHVGFNILLPGSSLFGGAVPVCKTIANNSFSKCSFSSSNIIEVSCNNFSFSILG